MIQIINNIGVMFFVGGILVSLIQNDLFKKVLSFSISQSGIIIIYLCAGLNLNGASRTPFDHGITNVNFYVDPVPQALMLTAIVVGFASSIIGLALVMKIKTAFGTIDDNEIELYTNTIGYNIQKQDE